MADLSARDREILDFEGGFWRYPGAKDQAIRDLFDVTPTRYAQQLNVLIDRPEALAYAPATVKRLRRLRDKRVRPRSLRRAIN